jgi:hypothetical protein
MKNKKTKSIEPIQEKEYLEVAESISFPETTAFDTVKKFIEAVKNGKSKDAIKLSQLTWVDTSCSKESILDLAKERIMVGHVGIREKKKIDECCYIFELRTDTGIYSLKVIKEKEAGKTDINGTWGVNPLSIHKL